MSPMNNAELACRLVGIVSTCTVEESVLFLSFLSSGSDLPSSPSSETSVPVIHGIVVF